MKELGFHWQGTSIPKDRPSERCQEKAGTLKAHQCGGGAVLGGWVWRPKQSRGGCAVLHYCDETSACVFFANTTELQGSSQNQRGGGDADLDFMHVGTLHEMEVVLIQQGAVTTEPCWPLWPEVNVAKPAEAIQGAGATPPRA